MSPQYPPPVPGSSRHGSTLLDVDELQRFENLLIFAKSTVEGFYAGKHKSPYRGASSEFADYKQYTPGDELSRLDWRVYGRTRRLYLRQFDEETDMTVYMLVDTSASMRYAGNKRQSKFAIGAKIAASLAYLMMAQGDKAALALFADKLHQYFAPGGTRRHLHKIVTELEKMRPSRSTGLHRAVSECNGLFKKKGRIVIISDFLDDHAALVDSLAQFSHRKFQVLLLQVLDSDELNLPTLSAAKFIDMENAETVQVDTAEVRAHYRARMKQMLEALARVSEMQGVEYRLVDTQRPYLDAIETYIGFRGKNNP